MPLTKNFKIVVEYDGSPFSGWQRQTDKITVQGEIERALGRILNQAIGISGSGRTDAGVHAFAQVANFHADTTMGPDDLKKGVNSLIKHPIVIRQCCQVDENFHARYSAISKEYHYVILNRPDPCAIGRLYQWHVRQPLDVKKMNECCRAITGTFDFKAFENTGSPRSSSVRTVFFSHVSLKKPDQLIFKITANGFLRCMVRNIVGTIVQAGLNRLTAKEFTAILGAKDRTKAGIAAPAHGLFLKKVTYS